MIRTKISLVGTIKSNEDRGSVLLLSDYPPYEEDCIMLIPLIGEPGDKVRITFERIEDEG